MMMEMDDSNIATIGQIERLLSASRGLRLKSASRTEKHSWLDSVLRRFKFHGLGRKQKGLLRRYMQQITGVSAAQLTRLIKQHLLTGKLSPAAVGTRSRFPVTYTRQDVELPAETDNLHGRLSGPATRHIFEDELKAGDLAYQRLTRISPSHIYNLREKAAYKAKALTVSRTKSVQTSIGVRRKPDPEGKPGQLRVDTVHQGDLEGVKGVYHINLVDEVTQWEVLVCVPEINEIMILSTRCISTVSRSSASARFIAVMSRTVACRKMFPSSSIRVSSTVAGNASPFIRLCCHSKKCEPSRMAAPIISPAISELGRPSGWHPGDRSPGVQASNSSWVLAPNRASVAGFPEVNLQAGGASVIRASREVLKRLRYLTSLSASPFSAHLRLTNLSSLFFSFI